MSQWPRDVKWRRSLSFGGGSVRPLAAQAWKRPNQQLRKSEVAWAHPVMLPRGGLAQTCSGYHVLHNNVGPAKLSVMTSHVAGHVHMDVHEKCGTFRSHMARGMVWLPWMVHLPRPCHRWHITSREGDIASGWRTSQLGHTRTILE